MSALIRKTLLIFLISAIFAALNVPTANAGVASAPQNLTATASNLSVTLAWDLPASNGGETITDYVIQYSSDGGVTYVQVIDGVNTDRTTTVSSLLNGTQYLFRVATVVNVSGQGAFTTSVAATPYANHTPADLPKFSACPVGGIPAAGFVDITSTHVDCIKYYGITKGTTDTTFSPLDKVTRWQMALFLTRMVAATGTVLPDGSTQGFTDIGNYSTEIQTAINQIKQLGITIGKTTTTYAPADDVTREEMALFITRLLKQAVAGPGGTTNYVTGIAGVKEIKSNDLDFNFTDVPYLSMTMESRNAIVNLWNLGVTDVQTSTLFEPLVKITRKSMATFMTNALAHTNARPAGLVFQASAYRAPASPLVYFSVTHRDTNLNPVSGTPVDTFKYTQSVSTTVSKYDTNGFCTNYVFATPVGNSKCRVDSADPKTDAQGNLAVFSDVIPALSTLEYYAWTTNPTTIYDNDIFSSLLKKITISTYS